MKSSSYLVSLLSLITVNISHNVCAQELYTLLAAKNVPGALDVLKRIRRREQHGLLKATLFDAGGAGVQRAVTLVVGGGLGGYGAGQAVNQLLPLPRPARPSCTQSALAGLGGATGSYIMATYWLSEALGSLVGAPGAVTSALTALGGVGGYGLRHWWATDGYDQQVAQVKSREQTRSLIAGGAGAAMLAMGPSLYRTIRIVPSIRECCQYKHDGHNLWSIAFGMTDDQLVTFSTKFLEYDPPRELMNKPMRNGMYPIHAAVQRGSYELVKLFIKNNVIKNNADDTFAPCYSLDQEDTAGKTPLLYAAEEDTERLQLLYLHHMNKHIIVLNQLFPIKQALFLFILQHKMEMYIWQNCSLSRKLMMRMH